MGEVWQSEQNVQVVVLPVSPKVLRGPHPLQALLAMRQHVVHNDKAGEVCRQPHVLFPTKVMGGKEMKDPHTFHHSKHSIFPSSSPKCGHFELFFHSSHEKWMATGRVLELH